MASISERRTAIDRISDLPDHLITHILSFLSTKDAVRTSTLSTHWILQWALTTKLDIRDVDGFFIYKDRIPRNMTSFVNFIYRVLLLKVSPLDLFKLRCDQDLGVINVTQWISAALSRNVREINVAVPLFDHYIEFDSLFSCRFLVVLDLGMGFFLHVPDTIYLDSLKTLKLCEVKLENGESLSRLVSSCPVLERLEINGKLSESVDVLHISSSTLKYLSFYKLSCQLYDKDFEWSEALPYEVVLNTPSLQYLQHDDEGVADVYHIESNLNCLHKARLHFSSQTDDYDNDVTRDCSLSDLAVAMSNICTLDVSGLAFQAFFRQDCALPNYHRLTSLVVGPSPLDRDAGLLSLLLAFLQSTPQLASLTFTLDYEPELWVPPTNVPSCMVYNLKEIEVQYDINECEPDTMLSIAKYFLANTNCLEKLEVYVIDEIDEQFIKEVSLLPRASNSCRIEFT